MRYVELFVAGALLLNAVPHLTSGLQGHPFPTPFGKPRGVGNSSAFVNFLWGAFNLCAGLAMVVRRPLVIGPNLDCLVLAAGALLLGTYLSLHFARVNEERSAPS
jgi:hypothetical protein